VTLFEPIGVSEKRSEGELKRLAILVLEGAEWSAMGPRHGNPGPGLEVSRFNSSTCRCPS
jgi:hypothetical protein